MQPMVGTTRPDVPPEVDDDVVVDVEDAVVR